MKNEYRIVHIPDLTSVVINAGAIDDVKAGDKFEIFLIGQEIIDPETGFSLGTLDKIKAVIEVVIIYDKMCLCKNIDRTNSGITQIGMMLSSLSNERRELNVDKTQISGSFIDKDSTIVVGDKVRKLH